MRWLHRVGERAPFEDEILVAGWHLPQHCTICRSSSERLAIATQPIVQILTEQTRWASLRIRLLFAEHVLNEVREVKTMPCKRVFDTPGYQRLSAAAFFEFTRSRNCAERSEPILQ